MRVIRRRSFGGEETWHIAITSNSGKAQKANSSGAAATCDICGWEYLESELFRQDGYRNVEDLDNTGPQAVCGTGGDLMGMTDIQALSIGLTQASRLQWQRFELRWL